MSDFPGGWPLAGASPALIEALRTEEHAVVSFRTTRAGESELWRAHCLKCPWQTEADAPKAMTDAAARLHTTPLEET